MAIFAKKNHGSPTAVKAMKPPILTPVTVRAGVPDNELAGSRSDGRRTPSDTDARPPSSRPLADPGAPAPGTRPPGNSPARPNVENSDILAAKIKNLF
jgi:hypothetical protein